MKVIFLDIDGVLNCRSSKSRCGCYVGIDNDKVKRLRRIVEATGAKIVLCSSWKTGWSPTNKDEQDRNAIYMDNRLKRERLKILAKTNDKGCNRGEGIVNWITLHEVEQWVVLDDEIFDDYEEYSIMPHLVKTDFYDRNGGLQDCHVDEAIRILNKENVDNGQNTNV